MLTYKFIMSIDDIFNQYDQGIARQEEARRHEEDRALTLRAASREALEKCLREVIEPVLHGAKSKIIAHGHSCSVEFHVRADDVAGERVEYAAGIYLETPGGKFIPTGHSPKLLFVGDIKNLSLIAESDYGSASLARKSSDPIAISSVTSAFVTKHIEEFLGVVFRPPQVA